jgi:MFS family permease
MADERDSQTETAAAESAEDDCPLAPRDQSRNVLCFAGFWCIYYLAAPVSYVGINHANLLKDLGNSDTVANLPHAVYQWLTAFPILVAWFLPQPKLVKPLLVIPLVGMAIASAAVSAALWLELPSTTVSVAVIAHGAVLGACNGVLVTTLWEALRRGVSTARRGQALGVTFGVGPLLACVGSLAQQALFAKEPVGGIELGIEFPQNYLALFAASVPLLLLAIVASASFVVPLPPEEPPSESRFAEIVGGLRHFFTYRPIVFGAVAYLLVYSGGNAILDNVSMHAKDVLGEDSARTMGTQNFLRFAFKAVTGGLLGWLLAKTNPKATLLTTTAILLFGMAWALNASGRWYLISAGLLGAGELFGAYFPNYVATASAKSQVRANIAYLNLLGSLVGFASVIFGQISDRFGRIASFHTASGVLVVAMILIIVALPARPAPRGD